MNLAFDPWIPCTCRNGAMRRASLLQCLTEGELADLAVRPHERVALMRLFLCVACAALGIPKDYMAWQTCRERLPEAARRYLEQWRDSFELFHPEKPFLQVAGLRGAAKPAAKKSTDSDAEAGGPKPTSKLDFALATGNNSTLFDHEALNPHRAAAEPEKLALDLLTFQMFSPAGTISIVTWNGQTSGKSSSDAPCAPASMLHSCVRGADLPETVWLNLLSAEDLRDYAALTPGEDGWQGRPLWEMFPAGPDDKGPVHNATRTFIGRLVPLSRAIWLRGDGVMLLGDGLTYPTFSKGEFPPEPSAAVVVRKGKKDAEELTVLGVQPGKALWRQLHALTVRRAAENPGGCLALAHVDDAEGADLVVGGLARDQASVIDAVESVFHVPAAMLREEGHDLYEHEVRKAEEVDGALGSAMKDWSAVLDGGHRSGACARLRAQASRDYWSTVEGELPLLLAALDALGTDDYPRRREKWRKMLRTSALSAYTTACRGDGERQLRAFAAGKKTLLARAAKTLELHKEEEA
ncbi:MAG: type I-E CRISPR-associated protein Cse1/CasA [Desulfovibrionaceae bacterium]|nr:type I-E CRISPR-associated protein Cse1/CasA [Desulfovibrionaceae bacterium]